MAGVFFFITIVKLSSPVIIDRSIEAPQDLGSAINFPWPPRWGVMMFVPFALAGLFAMEWNSVKLRWVIALPMIWLVWEFISATQSLSPTLTKLHVQSLAALGRNRPGLVLGHAKRDGTALRRA